MADYIYLIAPFCGWVVAQSIKFVLSLRKDGVRLSDAVQSGGMPSSHAAFMVALTTVIGLGQGFSSPIFAVSFAVSAIVIYDATSVRLTTGQQTDAIYQLAKAQKITLKTAINNARGHKMTEVIVGSAVGVVVGLALYKLLV